MDMRTFSDPTVLMRVLSISFFAVLPFFFLPLSWVSILQSKVFLVSLFVIGYAGIAGYACWRDRTMPVPKSLLALAVFSLPLVYAISALFGGALTSSFVSGTGAQDTVVSMILFFGVFLFIAQFAARERTMLTSLLRALIAGSLVLMLAQVLQVLVPSVSFGVLAAPAASIFGSWHEVGIVAGLFIYMTLALWDTPVLASYWRWLGAVLAVLSALMLVIVNMVDVWYTFGALMFLHALYTWYSTRGTALAPIVAAILIGLAAVACGAFATAIYDNVPTKLQVLQVEVRPSWRGTFTISRESVQGAKTALLGTGPNTFTRQWSLYKPPGVNSTEFWNVDFNAGAGTVATTFITVGAFGLLAWGLVLGALAWSARRLFRNEQTGSDGAMYTALFGSALYLAAFHLLYVPTVSLSFLTFALLGLIAAHEGVRSRTLAFGRGSMKETAQTALAALAVAIIILAALWSLRAMISDALVNRSAVVYAQSRDPAQALNVLRLALFMNPDNDRGHRAAVELGLIRLGELAAGGATTDQATAVLQVSLETTIQHGLAAVSINSGDYQNWLALAGLYRELAGAGVQGAYEKAREAYAQAHDDNPQNPLTLVQMAQLEIALANYGDARALLDRAIGMKADFAAAYFLRSNVFAAQNDLDPAIEDAEAVVRIAPEDALGWYNLGSMLYADGSYIAAAAALERAVALQSNYANALFTLGLSYERIGRIDDAIAALERVAALSPTDENLKRIIEDIRAGRAVDGGVQE